MNVFDNLEKQLELENPAPEAPASEAPENLTIEQINNLISNGLKSAQGDIKKMCEDMISAAISNISNKPEPESPAPDKDINNKEGE